MKTSSAKAKGRRACQEVRGLLLAKFHEMLLEDDVVVTPSGVTGEDLHLSPIARKLFPFVIECKNQEKLNIWDGIKQAQSHVKNGLDWLLVFKRNNSRLHVVLDLEVFLKLYAPKLP